MSGVPSRSNEYGLQDFERDLPLVLEVVGQVDSRHAALAKLAFDGVAAFEGCVEACDGIGHGRYASALTT